MGRRSGAGSCTRGHGEWRLTTAERKRILLNHIYGVDIDSQAVEVTKLSLLLKVLEGESPETLSGQLSCSAERVLPDLGNNIKCGNSLIGPDFYELARSTCSMTLSATALTYSTGRTSSPKCSGGLMVVLTW